jgi:RNA polymerase sigma-70 factor, ECF subfamily
MTAQVNSALAGAFREEWGQIVASLIGTTRDWDLAEECAQEAFAMAMERWPRDGIPERPGAWLTRVARNCAIDRLRREAVGTARLREIAELAELGDERSGNTGGIRDDRLRLIFTCCHPALSLEAQVALTLRTLTGLTTAEIARAFLVPEATMAKRLVRVKHKIRNAALPYRIPQPHLLPQRLNAVRGVLYLLFNEGYSATGGANLVRQALSGEAIRLTRALDQLMPTDPEIMALLALMLLHDARRASRTDAEGKLVILENQDRTRWDGEKIAEGTALLETALQAGRPGQYQIQAAIAACHATAPTAADTDWYEIAALYGELAKLVTSPVIQLNRAVAIGMAAGAAHGLLLVDRIAATGTLASYHLLHATRADLLRRLGRSTEAAVAYRKALELAGTEAERRHLTERLAETLATA